MKPKVRYGSRMSQTRWKEPVLAENLPVLDRRFATTVNNGNSGETHVENAGDSQSQDKANHSTKPNFVRFITPTSHKTEQQKKESPKKLFLEAVVIPNRPPFSPKKLPSRRRELEPESGSEDQGKNVPSPN